MRGGENERRVPRRWKRVGLIGAVSGTIAVVSTDLTLPSTGAITSVSLGVGLAAVAAGTALTVAARRRREASPDA